MQKPKPEVPPSYKPKVPAPATVELGVGVNRALQVNFCKNPRCKNFGVAPVLGRRQRRASVPTGPGTEYTIAASGSQMPLLKCRLCGEHLPIKSNQGVQEEINRISSYQKPKPVPCCKNLDCVNHIVPITDRTAYRAYGRTDAGSLRLQCRACLKTVSVPTRSTLRQREIRKNVPILKALMGKVPLSRIVDQQDISFQTLYDKIDFFYERCQAFLAQQEAVLPAVIAETKRYIAVDRQDYPVNWSQRKDKRNVVLRAIGSADLETGYVFGMHLNFDKDLFPLAVDSDAKSIDDYALAPPFRKYGRLWLEPDYAKAIAESATRLEKRGLRGGSLQSNITGQYADSEARVDVESSDLVAPEVRFPISGMQVRSEYTMYAHFFWLHHLLRTTAKTRFYMDQESGIRAACLAAFEHEIRNRTCDAFYVQLVKEITVDEKRKLIRESRKIFQGMQAANLGLTEGEVKVLMMKQEIARAASFGKWSDRWVLHPFPNQAEPMKSLCFLTDLGDYDNEHMARLYLRGSLHAIDRFFMSIRRRINMLERPIATSSRAGRTWYGYSAYQPANIEKLLTIFRTYYNFCIEGQDKKTPAMRIGLSNNVVPPRNLLD